MENLYEVSALGNFFFSWKIGKKMWLQVKIGFQLNMAKLIAFSLKKHNCFQL